MKFVLISDTHCRHSKLKLPVGDVLIHAGDWTHRGERDLTIDFLKWFDKQNYEHKIFIAGNHDFFPEKSPVEFKILLETFAPSCHYLQDNGVVIEGLRVHGSPVSLQFNNWAFGRTQNIRRHWAIIPPDVDILVTHTPIYGFGDTLGPRGSQPGRNAGCAFLLNEIETRLHKLKLHVGGHIHEGYGVYQHNNIKIVNASSLDDRYKLKNEPVVMKWEKGLFTRFDYSNEF